MKWFLVLFSRRAIVTVSSVVTAASISAAAFLGLAGNEAPMTAEFEGTVLANYYDGVGVETWCTGETQVGYKPDGNYTKEECAALFKEQFNAYSARTYSCYTEDMKQYVTPTMHATFADLNYNTGVKCPNSVMSQLKLGEPVKACDGILRYKYAGGNDCSAPGNRTCSGVWKRRIKTHGVCVESAMKLEEQIND